MQLHIPISMERQCYHSGENIPPSSNPSYIWYKNGQIIQGETSDYTSNPNNADSYSCALKGYEDCPSPAVCEFTLTHIH